MMIPKYLQRPGMRAEEKKRLEKWILSKRETLKTAPTYETKEEATKRAVDQEIEEEKTKNYTSPTVWKEPEDIGTKYAIVEYELRENAMIGGYTEEVNYSTIYDIAHGRNIDEIEEV